MSDKQDDSSNSFVTEEWVKQRWGGFTYLIIARNEDFILDYRDESLWLHYERDDVVPDRVLLLKTPSKSQFAIAETLFGIFIF